MGYLIPQTAGVLLVLYLIFDQVRTYIRLAHIPGPKLRGWSRLPQAWQNASGYQYRNLYDINEKYGNLARIAPNHLVTSDPELMMRMSAANSPYRRSAIYSAFRFRPREDHVFSTRDEKLHTQLRRKVALGYGGKEVPHIESQIETHIGRWINLVRQKYLSTESDLKPADLSQQAQFFTLDAITDIAMDNCFGDLDLDQDRFNFAKTMKDALGVMQLLTVFTEVYKFLEVTRILDLLAPSLKDKEGLGPALLLAKESVDKRLNDSELKEKPDMLGAWLRQGLSPREVQAEAILPLVAGSDTTATAIRVFFLYVLSNPIIYRNLQAEIDQSVRDSLISSPIKQTEARKMPYLQACINETLRICPPAVGMAAKVVPPEGDTINGYFVPGGTWIGTNVWAISRNTEIFGSYPEYFRPERWLKVSEETFSRMERTVDLIFGYGRYRCLGVPVAWLEFNKVFVEILRRFDITMLNPSMPMTSFDHGVWLQGQFMVKIVERDIPIKRS